MNEPVTKEHLKAAFYVLMLLAEAVREAGSIPDGHLYAAVMHKLDLQTYTKAVDTLVEAGVVARDGNHLLTWVGGDQ